LKPETPILDLSSSGKLSYYYLTPDASCRSSFICPIYSSCINSSLAGGSPVLCIWKILPHVSEKTRPRIESGRCEAPPVAPRFYFFDHDLIPPGGLPDLHNIHWVQDLIFRFALALLQFTALRCAPTLLCPKRVRVDALLRSWAPWLALDPCPCADLVVAFLLLLLCGIQHDWVDPGSLSAASCVLMQRCLDFVLSLARPPRQAPDTRSGPARSADHSLRSAWSSRPLPDARLPLTVHRWKGFVF
jgi:hypothetical protein